VAFDFGAHGLSGGDAEQSFQRMLQELLSVVVRNFPSMHVPVIVAHSAGATIVKKALQLGKITTEKRSFSRCRMSHSNR